MSSDELTMLDISGAPNTGTLSKLPLFYDNLSFIKLK